MSVDRIYSIRRYRSSDEDEIVNLLNVVFNRKFTKEWWKWKYVQNPSGFHGEEGDIWVAEKDEKIIGHYAIIPEKIKFRSKLITIAQSVDTATHPNFRRMGIFSTLAEKVYSEGRERYPFIYGFPSEMAYKGFTRLGWEEFDVSDYIKILNYDNPLKKRFDNNLFVFIGKLFLKTLSTLNSFVKIFTLHGIKGENITIEEVNEFPFDIDDFWKMISQYEIVLDRSQAFLNWRFSKLFGDYRIFIGRSVKNNNILGYVVLRKRENENIIDIVDLIILVNEDKAMLQLVSNSVEVAKNDLVDSIHCFYPEWNKNIPFFKRLGFILFGGVLRRFTKNTSYRFILYNLNPAEKLPNIKDWFYTLADTDYG